MDVKQKTSRVQTRLRSVVDLIVFLSSVCSSCGGGAQQDDRKCAIYRHSGAQAPLLELQIQSKITTWSFLVTFHGERVTCHHPPTHTLMWTLTHAQVPNILLQLTLTHHVYKHMSRGGKAYFGEKTPTCGSNHL